jgi:hypothetical protein
VLLVWVPMLPLSVSTPSLAIVAPEVLLRLCVAERLSGQDQRGVSAPALDLLMKSPRNICLCGLARFPDAFGLAPVGSAASLC